MGLLESKIEQRESELANANNHFSEDYDVNVRNYVLDAATLSGILKAKQKLGVTFNSDKLGGIDFTKSSKLIMYSVGAGRCWLVQWPKLQT